MRRKFLKLFVSVLVRLKMGGNQSGLGGED
jgi:hypothetical protein